MDASARESYLVTQVTTATPQRLHLMLIDAAIRHTRRTIELWEQGQEEDASESLIRAQQIVTELLSNLNPQADGALARKLAAIYMFVFRALVGAHVRRDAGAAQDAIRVLNEERETWQQLCQLMPGTASVAADEAPTNAAPSPAMPIDEPGPVAAGPFPGPISAPHAPLRSGWPLAQTGYGPSHPLPGGSGLSLDV